MEYIWDVLNRSDILRIYMLPKSIKFAQQTGDNLKLKCIDSNIYSVNET